MRRTLTLLIAALALAACGSSDDSEALDWTAAKDPAGANGGLAWADAQTGEVHLPDGVTLAADRAIRSFVVAGAGAYVVDKDSESLVEVTADGARATGAYVNKGAKASPNGRYLAFIDPKAGPKFEGTTHQLTSVVVDLKTGKEVLRSTRGMGDPEEDDLTNLYESAAYGVLAVSDETAWFSVPDGGVLSVDLASGKVSSIRSSDISDENNPWATPRLSPPTPGGPANSDRSWAIYHVVKPDPAQSTDPAVTFPHDELESADGSRLVPRADAENWYLKQWVDDTTVAGFANTGLDDPEMVKNTRSSSLLTCTVPGGACDSVPDSEYAILPEPNLLE
ncbi:hypothetical protein GEV29_08950 [Aeromicrobium sp. SMF47]|uniref:hypothetical protein n=1 Tax=Aeromicrobium yanjiei TaxID=2662028 RepID=UPI00129D5ECF|nr:hypothetical protein [Aeromicrobium yanjiei]MRJ76662.1 hypothetical protein [Aeromicrobium yanjiei]